MTQKTAIVTTAINIPKHLKAVMDNLAKFKHDNVEYIFIGDNKTPDEAFSAVEEYDNVQAWPISAQKEWIASFGARYNEIFKENNYQRRIIGFLIAADHGSENVIILDDDNFPTQDEDFVKRHKVGDVQSLPSVSSNVKYVNQCVFLGLEERVFARGFPSSFIHDLLINQTSLEEKRVVSNIGLWSGSPDVRADCHIKYPNLDVKQQGLVPRMVARDNYISYTVQNLSFSIDTLPAQYEFPMDEQVSPLIPAKIGRYDDILQGLILERVISEMDHRISFGPPQVIHHRHQHDYYYDRFQECFGDLMACTLLSYLIKMDLKGSDYHTLTADLIDKVKGCFVPPTRYFKKVMHNFSLWLELVDRVI